MPDQVTFRELLRNPVYKAWIRKPPQVYPKGLKPWRVWVQRRDGGGWAYVDYSVYVKAYNRLIQEIKRGAWDGAIACPSRRSGRPMVKVGTKVLRDSVGNPRRDPKTREVIRVPIIKPWVPPFEFHQWCPYCRRPTVWGYYQSHHAMSSLPILNNEPRCRICGVRETYVRRFHRAF